MYDIRLDDEILVKESGGMRGIGEDTADLRGSNKDNVDPFLRHPVVYIRLAQQVQLGPGDGNYFAILSVAAA